MLVAVTKYAAQIHNRSGVRVRCMIVPAVTDTCRPQETHSNKGLDFRAQYRSPSHLGHRKPAGQRGSTKCCQHDSSVLKRSWNSRIDSGNAGLTTRSVYRS